mmetsp:Transcript_9714/g.11180  ORF Transcript_9714/g.11180 Transcript_9714/m.11180 type:complete len:273 (+) Transcript_9714:32-850(+)
MQLAVLLVPVAKMRTYSRKLWRLPASTSILSRCGYVHRYWNKTGSKINTSAPSSLVFSIPSKFVFQQSKNVRSFSTSFSYEEFSAPPLDSTIELADKLIAGERVALSRAITLIESVKPEHAVQAQHLLEYVLARRKQVAIENGNLEVSSFRLGIAGPPGAGKSTFTEALGCMLVERNHRVAVVAVDPSSTRTGGSILGDKTRMNDLSKDKRAFVRPSPTSGMLGGIAQHTNDVVLLCEAAGFDIVIVETVGLGQSEVQVDQTVDMLMLLVSK